MIDLILGAVAVLAILAFVAFWLGMLKTVRNIKKDNESMMATWGDGAKAPELREIKGKITEKHCYTELSGTKQPELKKRFIVTFEASDGEVMTYSVDEDVYLEVEENKSGTAAIVGDRFYGFCVDRGFI